jgi:DNA-binding LacI/PurR family transcriptional regulator
MTLQEVARRAKVSPATVSRVLNDTGRVKEAARARVLKAVRELDYHPNIHARTLARGRSRTLGLIVSNLKNPFFLDIFQAWRPTPTRRASRSWSRTPTIARSSSSPRRS